MGLRQLNRKKKLRSGSAKQRNAQVAKLYSRGLRLQEAGEFRKACDIYEGVLKKQPNNAAILNDLGVVYELLSEPERALSSYTKAVALDGNNSSALYNIANMKRAHGNIDEAIKLYRRVVEIDPENLEALQNLGTLYYDLGYIKEAVGFFREILARAPNNMAIHSALIAALQYLPETDDAILYDETTKWWGQHGKPLYRKILHPNTLGEERTLRIGYVSPDFREHSVSYFFIPLLKNHSASVVETFCYSDVQVPDKTTERICSLADHWCDTSAMSDQAFSLQVQKDRIDILVDLCGHMKGNRLGAFAMQPAPVQLSWLGYPGTTGLPVIQYRLVDVITDSLEMNEQLYSEQLVRLPHGFLCYEPPLHCPEVQNAPSLTQQGVTFGSFNNPAKMNDFVLQCWAKILKAVPTSRLFLKGRIFTSSLGRDIYVKKFEDLGVDKTRIRIVPMQPTIYEHLQLYNEVDIALDTFPYNGTTTTCEALLMGVPVVTILGARHAARVSTSLLKTIELNGFVAGDEEEFVEKAIFWATEGLDDLQKLRMTLRKRVQSSMLCDGVSFSRQIEQLYRSVWRDKPNGSF